MLYSHREETATSGPVVSISLQWPAGPSQQPVQHNWPACTLLVLQQKDPVPSPQGDVAVGLARCHMMHMLYAETKEHSLPLEKKKIFPHKAISLTQSVWVLHLLVRMCSRFKAHSYMAKWRLKDYSRGLLFPTESN